MLHEIWICDNGPTAIWAVDSQDLICASRLCGPVVNFGGASLVLRELDEPRKSGMTAKGMGHAMDYAARPNSSVTNAGDGTLTRPTLSDRLSHKS